MITCILADWSQIVLRDVCLCVSVVLEFVDFVFLMSGLLVPVVTLKKDLLSGITCPIQILIPFIWLGMDIHGMFYVVLCIR